MNATVTDDDVSRASHAVAEYEHEIAMVNIKKEDMKSEVAVLSEIPLYF